MGAAEATVVPVCSVFCVGAATVVLVVGGEPTGALLVPPPQAEKKRNAHKTRILFLEHILFVVLENSE